MASRYIIHWVKTTGDDFPKTMEQFEAAVQDYLAKGWQLQGGVSVTRSVERSDRFNLTIHYFVIAQALCA